MFKSIKIQNFESWPNIFIKFHKGVNVIIGHSDTGKSGLFRSIIWPLINRPLGESIISWLENENDNKGTGSLLILDNTHFITRYRNDNSNIYELSTFDEPFKAFGTKVPEEIQQELNIDSTINIQNQTDPHFLLSSAYSPGEVAKILNRVSNLNIINSTLFNGKTDVQRSKTKIENIKESIKEKEKELKQYEHLDSFEILLNSASIKEEELEQYSSKKEKLNDVIDKIQEIEEALKVNKIKYQLIDKVNECIAKQKEIKQHEDTKYKLQKTIYRIQEIKKTIKNNKKKYKLYTPICNALLIEKGIKKLKYDKNIIEANISCIKEFQKNIKEKERKLIKLKNKFNEQMPDICPLCGRS